MPLGINLAGYERGKRTDDTFRVGYFARVSPGKGPARTGRQAYKQLRARTLGEDAPRRGRLHRAGAGAVLDGVTRDLAKAGLADEFTYHGAVDRAGKLAFLQTLDVLSVPAPYDEPKGVFLLEAMGEGVPVVQPRRGAFTEIVEKTGGGLLVPPDDTGALADALHRLWQDRPLTERLGRAGFDGVREHYSITRSTDRLMAVYESLVQGPDFRLKAEAT